MQPGLATRTTAFGLAALMIASALGYWGVSDHQRGQSEGGGPRGQSGLHCRLCAGQGARLTRGYSMNARLASEAEAVKLPLLPCACRWHGTRPPGMI